MAGKRSQRKGRTGELELVRILNENNIPAVAGRSASFGTVPDVVGVAGIHCEVKRNEKLNVTDAVNQAVRDAEKFQDGLPTVFHRKNRTAWLVTMTLADWLTLYKDAMKRDGQ